MDMYSEAIINTIKSSEKSVILNNKDTNKVIKKLKKLLKDMERVKRMGGLTIIIEGDSVITTYYTDSMNRQLLSNNKKLIY